MRVLALVATTVVGLLSGLGGATQLNLSGLVWVGDGFGRAPYWEDAESEVGVALASALLVVWVASLIVMLVVSRTGPTVVTGLKTKTLGVALVTFSTVLTLAALVVALFVLPAQYSWMYY